MKGHITRIEEMYPGGPHWYATILPAKVKSGELRLGWIKVWYPSSPQEVYHCKVESITPYEEALRSHIALGVYWSPEADVDEGDCSKELRIGDIEFEDNDEQNAEEDYFEDCLFKDSSED